MNPARLSPSTGPSRSLFSEKRASLARILGPLALIGATFVPTPSSAQGNEDCRVTGLIHVDAEAGSEPDSIGMILACEWENNDKEFEGLRTVPLPRNEEGFYPMPFDKNPYVTIRDDGQPCIHFEDEGEWRMGIMPDVKEYIYSFRHQLARLGDWQR